MQHVRLWFEKTYLDEMPELNNTVRDFFKSLDLGGGLQNSEDYSLHPIECRGRDGFIPASHNHGGWDVSCLHSFDYEVDGEDTNDENYEYPIWQVGVRFMYEGLYEEDIHVACLHLCASTDEYRGAFADRSSKEIVILFHNKTELMAELEKYRHEMENIL